MSIQELEAQLNGGARENRFRLTIAPPAGTSGNANALSVLCLSTAVPGKTRGAITIQHTGKTARVPGDSVADETFEINVQVGYDAEAVYGFFNDWYNLGDFNVGAKTTVRIEQLGLLNETLFTWNVTGAWVSTLPPIDFNRESQDTIKQFAATLTLDDVVVV